MLKIQLDLCRYLQFTDNNVTETYPKLCWASCVSSSFFYVTFYGTHREGKTMNQFWNCWALHLTHLTLTVQNSFPANFWNEQFVFEIPVSFSILFLLCTLSGNQNLPVGPFLLLLTGLGLVSHSHLAEIGFPKMLHRPHLPSSPALKSHHSLVLSLPLYFLPRCFHLKSSFPLSIRWKGKKDPYW